MIFSELSSLSIFFKTKIFLKKYLNFPWFLWKMLKIKFNFKREHIFVNITWGWIFNWWIYWSLNRGAFLRPPLLLSAYGEKCIFLSNLTPVPALLLSASGEKGICTEPYSCISALSTEMKIFVTKYYSNTPFCLTEECIFNGTLLFTTPVCFREECIFNGTLSTPLCFRKVHVNGTLL